MFRRNKLSKPLKVTICCYAPNKIRSIWEIWSEKKNAEHFDRIVLSGEKERQIFAEIDQNDLIYEKERNHYALSD